VLVDAFVVRMTLVPALLSLLGHSAWWLPRWLDRILPDVDVEGERLRTALGDETAGPAVGQWPVIYGTVRGRGGAIPTDAVVTLVDLRGRQIGSTLVVVDGTYLCRIDDGADTQTVVVVVSAPGHVPGVMEARHVEGPVRRHAVLAPIVRVGQGAAAGGIGEPGSLAGQVPR
jgi:RND superfamily putative drug exporter